MEPAHFRKTIAYLDGALPPGEAAAFAAELRRDPALAAELQTWHDTQQMVRDALEAAAPAVSYRALRPRLADVRPLDEALEFVPRLRVQGVVPRVLIAGMVVLCAVGPWAALRAVPAIMQQARVTVTAHTHEVQAAHALALAPLEEDLRRPPHEEA